MSYRKRYHGCRLGHRGIPPSFIWLCIILLLAVGIGYRHMASEATATASLSRQVMEVREVKASDTGLWTAVRKALLERLSAFAAPQREKRLSAPENALLSPVLVAFPLCNPVSGRLTSGYGYRLHPTSGTLDFHTGVDIAAPEGTPISAALPGVVRQVDHSPIYGNYILLQHGNFQTRYCHCLQITAQEGQKVREGEYIAQVGATGVATGSHLHFEVLVEDKLVDPLWVLPEGEAAYWTLP